MFHNSAMSLHVGGVTLAKRVRHSSPGADCNQTAVLIVGEWQYVGRGNSPGEAVLARTIAQDLALNRRVAK